MLSILTHVQMIILYFVTVYLLDQAASRGCGHQCKTGTQLFVTPRQTVDVHRARKFTGKRSLS